MRDQQAIAQQHQFTVVWLIRFSADDISSLLSLPDFTRDLARATKKSEKTLCPSGAGGLKVPRASCMGSNPTGVTQ